MCAHTCHTCMYAYVRKRVSQHVSCNYVYMETCAHYETHDLSTGIYYICLALSSNTFAETFGTQSHCIEHGLAEPWTVNGRPPSLQPGGSGCYEVIVVPVGPNVCTFSCLTHVALTAGVLHKGRRGDECFWSELHLHLSRRGGKWYVSPVQLSPTTTTSSSSVQIHVHQMLSVALLRSSLPTPIHMYRLSLT